MISDVAKITPDLEYSALLNLLEDMQIDKEVLAKQRLATLNILEDINEAQTELTEKYKELEIIKDLTQKLGSSLELSVVRDHIASAYQNLFPDLVISCLLAPLGSHEKINKVFVYTRFILSDSFISQIKDQLVLGLKTLPKADSWQTRDLSIEIVGNPKEQQSFSSPSFVNVPIAIPGSIGGLINLSHSQKGFFTKKRLDVIYTMIATVNQTIQRLRMLIASEQSRLSDLVQSMTNGVLMFDYNKQIILANPVVEEIVNKKREHILLDEFLQSLKITPTKSQMVQNLTEAVDEVLQKAVSFKFDEIDYRGKIFEIFVGPVRDFEQKVTGGALIFHDITHIMEVDRMKTEFVSLASHQLRTPLTSINWYIEMLQAGDAGDLNDKQKEFLSEVYKGSKRMVQLVNDLLNVSRLETGRLKIEPVPTDLIAFIQGIRKEVEPQVVDAGYHVTLEFPEKKVSEVNIDKILLRQVIINLLTNAIRYSANGKNGQVHLSLAVGPQAYTITVKDNGIGIPKDAQDHIFEKFFRADNARTVVSDGNGLGLYLAKQIMDASGGTIGFTSDSGQDTTFYVTIPLTGMKSKQGEKGLEG